MQAVHSALTLDLKARVIQNQDWGGGGGDGYVC